MNSRSYFTVFAAFLGIVLGMLSGQSQALPLAVDNSSLSQAASGSVVHKAGYDYGYGCGWDYACPPRPYFRRRYEHRPASVYIRNNYGTVNVYVNRWRREHWYHRTWEPRRCCAGEDVRSEVRVESPRCFRASCGPECDSWCWFRRFRQGYCGHGCEVYREKVRFERAQRTYDYPRPVYYREAPTYRPYVEDEAPAEYIRHDDADSYERRPFEGPRYPHNCSGDGC